MGVEQIYSPMMGISRMVADIESFLEPILFKLHPVLQLMSRMNFPIVLAVFISLCFYILIIKKHRVIKRFKERETYIFCILGFIIFYILNKNPIPLGGDLKFNFALAVMPTIAKFFGPIVSMLFGIGQYFVQFLGMRIEVIFSPAMMLTGGISGLLYSLFLYDKRTKYVRCFLAKLTVNMVSNVLLVPLANTEVMSAKLANDISRLIIENLFMVPFQALAIFLALKLIRKIRMIMRNY